MPASTATFPRYAIALASALAAGAALAALAVVFPVRADTPVPQVSSPPASTAVDATRRAIGKNVDMAVRRPTGHAAVPQQAVIPESTVGHQASPSQVRGHEAATE